MTTIFDIEIDDSNQPSKTYKISDNNTIAGFIDGIDAVKQAVALALSTERFNHPIYSWDYGVELECLVGKDILFIYVEIKRRIKEALEQDDRIASVSDFKYTRQDDSLLVEFTVETDYGKFDSELAVNV